MKSGLEYVLAGVVIAVLLLGWVFCFDVGLRNGRIAEAPTLAAAAQETVRGR